MSTEEAQPRYATQMWWCPSCSSFICFFFQAEDGIRDLTVTGVQTCALPICRIHLLVVAERLWRGSHHLCNLGHPLVAAPAPNIGHGDDLEVELLAELAVRGEIGRASCRERCRSRWSPYH